MINELIFLFYSLTVALLVGGATLLGYEALVALMALLAVCMNLLVTKQIMFCGWQATAADALSIGAVLCTNMIQEFFGTERAKQAVWLSFAGFIGATVIFMIHCAYIPSGADTMQGHCLALFCPLPRIGIASLIAYLITQLCDRYLYAKLMTITHKRYFLLRNIGITASTQLLDTVLFGVVGLYGMVDNLTSVLFVSYVIKLCSLLLIVPALVLMKKVITRE
jgi:queuosine precursor transporter